MVRLWCSGPETYAGATSTGIFFGFRRLGAFPGCRNMPNAAANANAPVPSKVQTFADFRDATLCLVFLSLNIFFSLFCLFESQNKKILIAPCLRFALNRSL